MNTDLTITLSQEELAGLVALHIVSRLKTLLPMRESYAMNLESDLCENIIPQISTSITLQIVDGKVRTYYKDENEDS